MSPNFMATEPEKHNITHFFTAISQHFSVVRGALTLMLPIVIAGAFGVLVNNFPVRAYQELMLSLFGEGWHNFGGYVWNGTLAVLSIVMVFTIGNNLAEDYNSKHPLDALHPVIAGLVSFCSLMTVMEPTQDFAISYQWVGIHGLFLAILIGFFSSRIFLLLYNKHFLRIRFFSEASTASIANAFSSLLPALFTIAIFALFKIFMLTMGIPDIHALIYDVISMPFRGMGNTLTTALLYNLVRHLLWFVGIHGSNALEPVMTEIYVEASRSNAIAAVAGEELPYIFTKTFFDSYISIGGAGATFSLLITLLMRPGGSSSKRIAQISIIPGLFNINETLVFGLPIVLNPVYLAPFILTPIICTITGYYAITWGWVPISSVEIAWTTPVLISGYFASGSIAGALLQFVNLAIGVAVYTPFVVVSENMQKKRFDANYKELLRLIGNEEQTAGELIARTDEIGSITRMLANDLLQSIKRDELYLEYQPQVNCNKGNVTGVEALIRWRHSRIGRIAPNVFIVLAEEIGFINEIGLWVCDRACKQAAEWRDAGINDVVVSVNVSVKQLDDPDLPEKIKFCLDRYGVDPSLFKAEVTESTGLSSNMGHNVILQDIRLMGVNIAIDDFGMGHTSLVYLKQFPVSTIKLDGSLVRDVTVSKISSDIVQTISELCRSMNIELLAEYVETEDQARTLKQLGCCIFQGYLYSPSLSPEDCAAAIKQGFRVY